MDLIVAVIKSSGNSQDSLHGDLWAVTMFSFESK